MTVEDRSPLAALSLDELRALAEALKTLHASRSTTAPAIASSVSLPIIDVPKPDNPRELFAVAQPAGGRPESPLASQAPEQPARRVALAPPPNESIAPTPTPRKDVPIFPYDVPPAHPGRRDEFAHLERAPVPARRSAPDRLFNGMLPNGLTPASNGGAFIGPAPPEPAPRPDGSWWDGEQ